MTALQKIQTGFWLGIGFIIPLFISSLIGFIISYISTNLIINKNSEIPEKQVENVITTSIPNIRAKQDLKDQIKIKGYKEIKRENRLLILGVVENTGPNSVSSVQMQAELFDSKGQFVLECDEFLSNIMQPKDEENFQISCGCTDAPVPEYESIKIRVLTARNY